MSMESHICSGENGLSSAHGSGAERRHCARTFQSVRAARIADHEKDSPPADACESFLSRRMTNARSGSVRNLAVSCAREREHRRMIDDRGQPEALSARRWREGDARGSPG